MVAVSLHTFQNQSMTGWIEVIKLSIISVQNNNIIESTISFRFYNKLGISFHQQKNIWN